MAADSRAAEVRLRTDGLPGRRPGVRLWQTAALLFGSGACALVYQVAWLREMRLVFGASTPASAAVLAIFMGGLGIGGYLLGRRADRHPRPLELTRRRLCVAASAAATPFALVIIARDLRIARRLDLPRSRPVRPCSASC
jgi:hypothetical protein